MATRRVKFTFPDVLIDRPIIYDLSHQFEVITNIRRADVRMDIGWVVLELEGAEEEIERAIQWAESNGVRVDPIGGDVLEG